jgi:hypothetical protein
MSSNVAQTASLCVCVSLVENIGNVSRKLGDNADREVRKDVSVIDEELCQERD